MKGNGHEQRQIETAAKHQLFLQLIEKDGLTIPDAANLLGYKRSAAYQLARRVRNNKDENVISRTMPDRILRKADRRALQLLDGKAFGTLKEVKCSTVAKLVEATWSRSYPTRQDPGAGGAGVSFTQININQYRTAPSSLYGGSPPQSCSPAGEGGELQGGEAFEIKSLDE